MQTAYVDMQSGNFLPSKCPFHLMQTDKMSNEVQNNCFVITRDYRIIMHFRDFNYFLNRKKRKCKIEGFQTKTSALSKSSSDFVTDESRLF